jgi:hypothetical protein
VPGAISYSRWTASDHRRPFLNLLQATLTDPRAWIIIVLHFVVMRSNLSRRSEAELALYSRRAARGYFYDAGAIDQKIGFDATS